MRKIANQVAANSTVDLLFDGDAATLRAGLRDDGSATITAPISVAISETITPTLRFDIANLIDAIKTLDTPEVILAADVKAAKASCKVQVFPGDTVFDLDAGQSPMPRTNNLYLLVSRGI